MSEQLESPTTIRDRALAVADYLLAVRAQMERPARVLPADAHRLDALPDHPACQVGPAADGTSWLRVGLPDLPPPVAVPAALRRRLRGDITAAAEPSTGGEEATGADSPTGSDSPTGPDSPTSAESPTSPADGHDDEFATWRDQVWRPWAYATGEAEKTRTLHRRLFDLMHQLDMTAATTELVWGHGVLHTVIGGERVRYPLVATPVLIEYEPDRSLITVSPSGPSRLQTDALTGLEERYLAQLLGLAGPAGTVEADLWNDLERRELFERALGRLGLDRLITSADTGQPHVSDVGVLFARPRQRLLRGFLENLRDRLLAGDTSAIGALAAIVAHEPSRLRMPGDDPGQWQRVGV